MDILEKYYAFMMGKGSLPHLPHVSVFYVRAALLERTGIKFSLEHVERVMYEEGLLPWSEYGIKRISTRKRLDEICGRKN